MRLSKMTRQVLTVGGLAAALALACSQPETSPAKPETGDAASAALDAAAAAQSRDSAMQSAAGAASVISIITAVAPGMLDAATTRHSDPDAGAVQHVPPDVAVADAAVPVASADSGSPVSEDFPTRFDPDRVYVIGRRPESVASDLYAFQLAPVDALNRVAFSLPGFASPRIRRSSERLLYSFNPGWELREWRADSSSAISTDELVAGEPIIESAALPCGPIEPFSSRSYLVGWDGSVYHNCPESDAAPSTSSDYIESWYDRTGALAYRGPTVASIGPQGRALIWPDSGNPRIIDFLSNQTVRQVDLPAGVTAAAVNAARSYAQGFRFALTVAARREWIDVNLAGELQATGVYPALPAGVTIDQTFWGRPWSALDGAGTLYEFAQRGDDRVIIERPRQGASVLAGAPGDNGWSSLDELFSAY